MLNDSKIFLSDLVTFQVLVEVEVVSKVKANVVGDEDVPVSTYTKDINFKEDVIIINSFKQSKQFSILVINKYNYTNTNFSKDVQRTLKSYSQIVHYL
jgi:hypothetical protein